MLTYYLRQKERKEKNLGTLRTTPEKNQFLHYILDCCIAKKIKFIGVDFETQFTDKKTVKRKLVEGNHFRKSHSFQWKLFVSVEAISFS